MSTSLDRRKDLALLGLESHALQYQLGPERGASSDLVQNAKCIVIQLLNKRQPKTMHSFDALVDYEDAYVQPLIISAIRDSIPAASFREVADVDQAETSADRGLLQIRSYETIDFESGLHSPNSLFNAFIIRKALIRKHYLSNTIQSWVTKHPNCELRSHFKPAVEFEVDYAEFLDEALVEAFELRDSFARNEHLDATQREWWILKPGMSDRGQGIRLFSTEDELRSIFEGWEAENPSSDEEDDGEGSQDDPAAAVAPVKTDYIMTSHLRHFVAQPYIDPPLLLPTTPFGDRKFHIRTYIVAAGALRVYVYQHMLALFAAAPYSSPAATPPTNADATMDIAALQRFRDTHLTNTCAQADYAAPNRASPDDAPVFPPADSSVHLLSDLPLGASAHASLTAQIHATTAELFRAAAAQPTNFQPLPQSFEVFGVDFLVDAAMTVWLLEVNAFPDFAQTGARLRDLVVKGLWEEVVACIVSPFFDIEGVSETRSGEDGSARLVKVLDMNMGLR